MKMMRARDKKKSDLVPRLRFPAFRDVGEWEIKKLSELIKMIIPPKKLLTSEYQKSGLFPIVDQSQKYIAGWTNDKFSIIDKYQAVIIFGDHTCILKLIESPFAQGADGIKIFYCPSDVLTKYTYQYLLFNPIKMEEYKRHFSILKEKSITYPNDKIEQQRIVDCLSSLDERIAAETSKLDRIKDHKKGLLKQLFPVEGETLPQLRFPEFRDAGEWKKITLYNICDILPGYTFPEALQGKQYGQYPFCKVSDISKAISDDGGLLHRAINYIDSADLSILKAKPIPIGTTVFAKIGEALRLNRRAISTVECLIDNNAVGIKAKPGKLINYFLYILSQRIDLNEYCGGAVPSVSKTVLENIAVVIPTCSEQQRIANCLSSLDELIAAQTQKINLLKDHKKGLMQQLFPRIDKVLA